MLLLSACHNEEVVVIINSGTYAALGQEVGAVRLFTRSGEIKNTTTINNFVKRQDKSGYFVLNTKSSLYGITGTSLEFLSPDEAVYHYLSNQFPVNVIKRDNVLYLESKDTTELSVYIYNKDVNIYTKILTYTPLYADTLVSDTYLHTIKTKDCFYLTQKDDIIKFPRLSYVYVEPYSKQAGMYINNTFNGECVNLLNDLDTLAIQQTAILFLKK